MDNSHTHMVQNFKIELFDFIPIIEFIYMCYHTLKGNLSSKTNTQQWFKVKLKTFNFENCFENTYMKGLRFEFLAQIMHFIYRKIDNAHGH